MKENKNPSELVEDFTKKIYISGIGHRKYRLSAGPRSC